MLFRSKVLRVTLIVVPLILVALLWKAARRRPSKIALPAPIAALALSHDGRRLAIVTEGGQILWHENGNFYVLSDEQLFSFQSSPTIQFSRDSKTLTGTGFPSYEVIKVLDVRKRGKASINAHSRYALSFPTENQLQIKFILSDGGEGFPTEKEVK